MSSVEEVPESLVSVTFDEQEPFQSSKSRQRKEQEDAMLEAAAAQTDPSWLPPASSSYGNSLYARLKQKPSRGRGMVGRARGGARGARGRKRGRGRGKNDPHSLSSTAYLQSYPHHLTQENDEDFASLPSSKAAGMRTRLKQCAVKGCNNPGSGTSLCDVFGFYELKEVVERAAPESDVGLCTEHTLVSRESHVKRRTLTGRKWKKNLARVHCSQCSKESLVWSSIDPAEGCFNHCGKLGEDEVLCRVSCGLLTSFPVLDQVLHRRPVDTIKQVMPFVCISCYHDTRETAVQERPEVEDHPVEKIPLPPVQTTQITRQPGPDLGGVCKPLLQKDFVALYTCKLGLVDVQPWSVSKRGSQLEFILATEDTLRIFCFDEADMTFSVVIGERMIECGTLALFSRHLCVPVRHVLDRLERLSPCQGLYNASSMSEMLLIMAQFPADDVDRLQMHFEEDTGRQVLRSRQCVRLRDAVAPTKMNCSACRQLQHHLGLPVQDQEVLLPLQTPAEAEGIFAEQHFHETADADESFDVPMAEVVSV